MLGKGTTASGNEFHPLLAVIAFYYVVELDIWADKLIYR